MKSLSDYQKAVLAELDIPVWRLRNPLPSEEVEVHASPNNDEKAASVPEANGETIEPEELVDIGHPMAEDVQQHLQAMVGLSVDRWVVSSRLRFEGGTLYAPHPMYLATQPDTKRRVWELLGG